MGLAFAGKNLARLVGAAQGQSSFGHRNQTQTGLKHAQDHRRDFHQP
jgi:hypothetical protein